MEEFGTAWAVDDEEECPEPPPIPDICEDFGLGAEKPGYEAHVKSVLNGKLLFFNFVTVRFILIFTISKYRC